MPVLLRPLRNVLSLILHWEDPEGVPISAIIFGGRRSSVVPLVTKRLIGSMEFLWGKFSSETTAAAKGGRQTAP